MDAGDVLRAARRHWWLVATALAVALGVAGLATSLAVPQYATSMTFFVTAPGESVSDTYRGGLLSEQRVKSYAHLFGGDLARRVAAADGVELTSEQVQNRIVSDAVPNTMLLEAVVTDSDQARSERIANVVSREFISLVEGMETPPGGTTPTVKVELVAGPKLNPSPVSPRPVRNFALAVVLGLLLGVAAAMLRQIMDATVKTPEALQHVTGAPVLSVVPFDQNARKHTPLVPWSQATEGAARRSRSYLARGEAFRHLRTNLQFVDAEHPAKLIVVTSPLLEEGKSMAAASLAITYAEAGRQVALVEADLRRPRVAEYLGLESGSAGLSNVLAGQVGVNEVLQPQCLHNLYLLPSGSVPPNPSELLASRNMAALLERLREAFEVVIVDTPPVLPFTDAAVVAAAADGTVLVVRSGKTHQGRIRRAAASLRAVDARLLGSVLNMHAVRDEEGYYYHYGYRYRDQEPLSLPVPSPTEPSGNGAASTPDAAAGPRR